MSNLRNAFRQLGKRPVFCSVIVLMLALGIGATTAMFSLFYTILLEPLPVAEPGQLVNLTSPGPKWGMQSTSMPGGSDSVFSYPMFRDLESRQDVFTGLAAYRDFAANLSYERQTESIGGLLVSGRYFQVLGLQPARGRLIGPEDEPRVDESPVAVLGHAYWQRQFGADAGVVGETITVNGQSLTVIGIAPAGFSGTTIGVRPDIYVPLTLNWLMNPTNQRDENDRRSYWVYAFARLRDGISIERARAAISGLHRGILNEIEVPLNADMPENVLEQFRSREIVLEPGALGQSEARTYGRQTLNMLLGVTLLVLLIACVNIASLLLARAAARTGEIAVRASVGATRRHLAGQLLAETAMLAVLGGVASLPVAVITLQGIMVLLPSQQAATFAVGIDSTAVAFAAGATLLTLLLFGSFPALRASRADPGLVIKGHSANSTGTRSALRFRRVLTTVQIAFSVVLLVLAGLFARSLVNVARVELGMEVDSLVSFSVSPRQNGYGQERAMNVFDEIERELRSQPGVLEVSSATVPVLAGQNWTRSLAVEGFESGPGINSRAWLNEVSPGFFRSLSIPLLAGRDFTDADAGESARVAVVNERFVEKFGLGGDVVGKRFAVGSTATELDIEIVGIVADAKYSQVKNEIPPQYFLARRQDDNVASLSFYVRTGLDPDALLAMIPSAVGRVASGLPVDGVRTLTTTVRENIFLDRIIAVFSAAFAGLATLLAATGLYGVLAENVVQRTRELGLRLALGASPEALRSLVLRQVARMAIVAVPVGLAIAVGLGRAAEALLFGLSGYDPVVLIASVIVLAAVVLAAGYLPARRASSVAPMEALRYE